MRRLSFVFVLLVCAASHAAAPTTAERRVLLVTLDGLRWQEVFRGADEAYCDTESGGVPESGVAALREPAHTGSRQDRRRRLMPFLWGEIAAQGQIFGNRDRDSRMSVTNAEWISYPGYSELLCGFADPLITSNAPIPNRNVTVLEWLNGREPFRGRVAASGTWHVHPAILNVGRSRLPVWVSTENPALARLSPGFAEIDRWMRDIPLKARDEHYDAFAFRAALEMVDVLKPRVLYVALGEPDTNAHRRRYDAYLESITRCDRFVRELWEKLQSLDDYRGRTTLILTTDHGRGMTPKDWTTHNKTTPGANESWLAVLGPDTPARGERSAHSPLTSSQIAATVATAVGENLPAADTRAAPPIEGVIDRR